MFRNIESEPRVDICDRFCVIAFGYSDSCYVCLNWFGFWVKVGIWILELIRIGIKNVDLLSDFPT